MSHEVETMAYAGEVPWHGLGVNVSHDLTPDQMVVMAGLDWRVEKVGNYVQVPRKWNRKGSEMISIPSGGFALVRTKDNHILCPHVGDRYKPIQNVDIFKIFKEFVDAGEMKMETAGSLGNGKIIWGLAHIQESFTLEGGDKVEGFLLLSQAHTYGSSAMFAFTPIRVVCQNTLRMAEEGIKLSKDSKTTNVIRHSHAREFDDERADEITKRIRGYHHQFAAFKESATMLSQTDLSEQQGIAFITALFDKDNFKRIVGGQIVVPDTIDEAMNQTNMFKDNVRRILPMVRTQPGADLPSARNSAWNWLNVVSFFTDHEAGNSIDTRMESAWFGANERLKRRSLELSVAIAQGNRSDNDNFIEVLDRAA